MCRSPRQYPQRGDDSSPPGFPLGTLFLVGIPGTVVCLVLLIYEFGREQSQRKMETGISYPTGLLS